MLSEQTIRTIKATVPVLEVKGTDITTRFYQMLFEAHPELLNIFNHSNQEQGRQQTALANTVYAAAIHIDQLEAIIPAVKRIAHKHRSLGVKPDHYPIVGEFLLKAIKDVLGDAATDEIIQAWAEAYGVIADAFISVEKEMYKDAESKDGGWEDFKAFRVVKKEKESSLITSFYLQPEDEQPLPAYEPGQYISVRMQISDEDYLLNRQYSLSSAYTPDYYRISVKKEADHSPNGRVSTYLHKELEVGQSIEVSVPAGDFYANIHERTPITLISGGVGITPMLSMLTSIAEQNSERNVTFIHAARNEEVRAFEREVQDAMNQLSSGESYVIYEQKGLSGDFEGYLNTEMLKEIVRKDSLVYVCGPASFMEAGIRGLQDCGLSSDQIHYEFFGPALDLETVSAG
ncbi:NO-inducible flavohemoprotein [Jeotgalibacillus sp. R-1-5s-1]|uniref:NO-inducible flavohemoprotein n=1 Tax=Jeotgalibacillus sp. R-1-5s-1 TaxID=2555897 RepID=UPI00106B002A|nr:NO-inducible flavohemoprotein [Jeotgalibacillus sp. R-1-5s-1]TFD99687.1 NO-inducible flavohemoprotein [Jeotgalibacillus sp. R-1-5s-1]